MKKVVVLSLFTGLFLAACSGGESSSEASGALNYELRIVDSVQVDILSNGLNILDVNDQTGELLAIQSEPPIAYRLSAKGEVLSTMKRPGDDPEAVGGLLLSGEFFEDGIALIGRRYIKTYDRNFSLEKSLRMPYVPDGMLYTGFNHLFEISTEKGNQLISFSGGPQTEFTDRDKEFYQEYNLVDLVDPALVSNSNNGFSKEQNAELFKPIGRIEPGSRFLNGKAFYFLRHVFDVKNEKLIYAFEKDTILYELDLPTGKLNKATRIPFDEFILNDGFSLGAAGFKEQNKPRDTAGQIYRVFQTQGFTVIVYASGIKRSELMAIPEDQRNTREWEINYKKHLILKDGERVNTDLRLPEKMSYFNMADSEGYLWAHQNLDLLDNEPDFITFYKLKVVPVE